MKSGDLRERVTIQQYSATQNDRGEEVKTWAEVATVWASIEPLSGREMLVARDEMAEVTTRIRIRYRTGVTAKMRVLHGSNVYRIDGPPINGGNSMRELVLMCAAVDIAS